MIHVVNSLIAQFGPIDEVRVELARSLKQSAKERSDASTAINAREKENKALGEKIAEYGLMPSRRTIQKLRLWEETEHVCMYCGQPVSATEFLTGDAGGRTYHSAFDILRRQSLEQDMRLPSVQQGQEQSYRLRFYEGGSYR